MTEPDKAELLAILLGMREAVDRLVKKVDELDNNFTSIYQWTDAVKFHIETLEGRLKVGGQDVS